MDYKCNRAWAEISLDNIAHNTREIRRITSKKAEIMGVVKADAYGHGVLGVVKTLLENGTDRLAVSLLDEAIQLRKLGIECPVLVLGYTEPQRAEEIINNNVAQTVFSHDLAEALSAAAVRLKKRAVIHIKVDTGMTRVGFMPGYSAVKNIARIGKLPGLVIEGLYTHFASADEKDGTYTSMQLEKFMSIWSELGRIGILIPVKHAANSAALIRYPQTHMDMVRPGIIQYGLHPSSEHGLYENIGLKPAMTLKANVVLVKDAEKDTPVSYGRLFKTERISKIATIPIGYADGYTRLLTGKGRVLVKGCFAPVVGNICMDQCMIDVTDIDNVTTGDEVVLIGSQGDKSIAADELAAMIGTISYEIVSLVGKRIPRFYFKDGKVNNVLNYLYQDI